MSNTIQADFKFTSFKMNLEIRQRENSLFRIEKIGWYVLLLGCFSNVCAQEWSQSANFIGIERDDAVGFSIGDAGFVGTGRDAGFQYRSDFYKYENNTWEQVPSLIGAPRQYCSSFSFASEGCVINGIDDSGQMLNDLQCYSAETEQWEIRSAFPGEARQQSISFTIGSIGYCGLGRTATKAFNDWYAYDHRTDSWWRLPDFPEPRYECVSFVCNGVAYVGLGANLDGSTFDSFYAYSPVYNEWIRVADFPGEIRTYSIGFQKNGKGYICTGLNENFEFSIEVWEYDPKEDQWNQLTDFPYNEIRGVAQFDIQNCSYIVGGLDATGTRSNTNYEVCMEQQIKDGILVYPNPSTGRFSILMEEEKSKLHVYSISGELLKFRDLAEGYNSLDLTDLPIGIYLLRFDSPTGQTIKKVVIN